MKKFMCVSVFVCVCALMCKYANVCLSLRHLDSSGRVNNSWEGKQNWDV